MTLKTSRIFSVLLTLLFITFSLKPSYAQIERLDIKDFLDSAISRKSYSIDKIVQSFSKNSYESNILINKALRFNMFMDGQDLSSTLFSENCEDNSTQIGITNERVKYKYEQGSKNAKQLFNIAIRKEPSLINDYNSLYEKQSKTLSSLLKFSKNDCAFMLYELQQRYIGFFNDNKNGKNILSFNYLLNPEKEILDSHFQEYTSINNNQSEDFFFKIKIPTSWNIKEKEDFSKPSTIGVFEPFEEFLNATITASIFPGQFFTKQQMESENISDIDIIDFIYKNDESLMALIQYFDSNISTNKIICSLYSTGNHKIIFYTSYYDIGAITKNEILNGQIAKFFGALYFKNGQAINVIGTGINNDFNSFDYYSKLFFKVITSVKLKDVKKNTIYLTEEQNMKFIHLNFDELEYKFMLDTGASNIVLNKSILSDLLLRGKITKDNYIRDSYAEIADGSTINCQIWHIPEIKIGFETLRDIEVSVIDSDSSMPLFGMDGLNKLNVFKLNLKENEIILKRE